MSEHALWSQFDAYAQRSVRIIGYIDFDRDLFGAYEFVQKIDQPHCHFGVNAISILVIEPKRVFMLLQNKQNSSKYNARTDGAYCVRFYGILPRLFFEKLPRSVKLRNTAT